jgi:hypothetical protein
MAMRSRSWFLIAGLLSLVLAANGCGSSKPSPLTETPLQGSEPGAQAMKFKGPTARFEFIMELLSDKNERRREEGIKGLADFDTDIVATPLQVDRAEKPLREALEYKESEYEDPMLKCYALISLLRLGQSVDKKHLEDVAVIQRTEAAGPNLSFPGTFWNAEGFRGSRHG